MTMLNRDLFYTNPNDYRLANQGVAKISFPPNAEAREVLRGELKTFVCDGAYANGLSRILEAFLGSLGKGMNSPAVWISGFYGSGKSHLASMLASLWTNISFDDGATAEGLIPHLPPEVAAPLRELRAAAKRAGGVIAAGDTLGTGPSDPAEATLSIILRAVGLPTDLRAAQVAFWLSEIGILEKVKENLGDSFDTSIRNFILSPRFGQAVLAAKPELANDTKDLSSKMRAQFPEPPPVTVDLLENMVRKALTLGRKEMPLTLIVLDEVQQFIRQDPALTLKIQTMVERLSSRFDGKILVVATGQQALSDVSNLQKLLDRFPVQVALGEADVDAVIRKTVLRKKPGIEAEIKAVLSKNAGEISRHLRGSKLAHSVQDNDDAVLDWPLLPSRRRVWEHILRELDRTGLGGTLRGQLRTTLDATKTYADQPLGHVVPADFLYDRFATEAFNQNQLPAETRNRIEGLKNGSGDDVLKSRILKMIYMIGRISGDADSHGIRAVPEAIADLLTVDLAGEPELRRKVPELLQGLQADGAIIEVSGEWRLQTKESAEWEAAYRAEEKTVINDQASISRARRELLTQALESSLVGISKITQGNSKAARTIHRLQPGDKEPNDGVPLRVHNAWDEDLSGVEKETAAASPTDATVHLLIPSTRQEELTRSLATRRAAESVLHLKGIPGTESGKEAQRAMQSRADRASAISRDIISEAVQNAKVMQAGGQIISGSPTEAIKEAATNALARLYPKFSDADHLGWGKVFDRAQKKDPDALRAVDYQGPAESHPICKIILQDLGPGRKGADLRAKFTSSPYGWSQDTIDGALMVLSNAGILKVTGDDGKQASLPDLPRAKIGACTFRAETTVVTITQKMAVRGLLTEAGVPFEKEQESYALSALIDKLEALAKSSGGEAPAPLAEQVPEIATLRALSGNDLLAHFANAAQALREKIKSWDTASKAINQRMPNWFLAKRLIELGAKDQQGDIEHVFSARNLLANPDPIPPIVAAAADALRQRINKSFDVWDKAWVSAEERLSKNDSWQKLSADQKRKFREEAGLLPVNKPVVDTPKAIAEALQTRGFTEWDSMTKALPARVDDVLAQAAQMFEPKVQTVILAGHLLKSEPELDAWLKNVRDQLVTALANGPVIPKV